MELKGFQRKYLRGLAHDLKPTVWVGQKGMTEALTAQASEALDQHELIKVKFNDFKDPEDKKEIGGWLEEDTGASIVGMIGHTLILYRPHPDPEKRKITLPEK